MHNRDFATLARTATGTFLLAMALLLPVGLKADDVAGAARPESVLRSGGAELLVKLQGGTPDAFGVARLEPGVKPVLLLMARNASEQSIELKPVVEVLTTSPRSMLSRTPVLPTSIYRRECPLTVAGGGEQTLKLEIDAPIPVGSMVTVRLQSGEQVINALTFAIQGPAPALGLLAPTQGPQAMGR
jgi:hypothetical protein